MNSQDLHNLQEAYMEVYGLNEGLISGVKSIKKALQNKFQKPKGLSSRGIEVGATGVNKKGFDALRAGEPYRPSKKPQILGHGAYQAPKVGKVGGLTGGTGAAAYAGSQGSLGGSQEPGGVIASLTPKGARKLKAIEPQSVVPSKTFDKSAKIVRDVQGGKYPKSKKAQELQNKLEKAGFKKGQSSIPFKDLPKVNQKEQVDIYDIILSHLLDEEITPEKRKQFKKILSVRQSNQETYFGKKRPRKRATPPQPGEGYYRQGMTQQVRDARRDNAREENPEKPAGEGTITKNPKKLRKQKAMGEFGEQVDIYDIILSHLLDEGYAETQEQAEVIMVNMSEDWRESIVEGMGGAKNQDDYEKREKERQEVRDEHLRKYKSGELPFQKQKKADQAQEFLKKHPKK